METMKIKNSKLLTRALLVLVCMALMPMVTNARPNKDNVRSAYIAQLKKMSKAVNNFRTYFLLDITGDGIPELFVRTGTCEADAQLHIYTYNTCLTRLSTISACHCTFYQGNGYFVVLWAHMGDWGTYKYFLKNGKLMRKELNSGVLKDYGEGYPEPRESLVYEISFDNFGPIRNM